MCEALRPASKRRTLVRVLSGNTFESHATLIALLVIESLLVGVVPVTEQVSHEMLPILQVLSKTLDGDFAENNGELLLVESEPTSMFIKLTLKLTQMLFFRLETTIAITLSCFQLRTRNTLGVSHNSKPGQTYTSSTHGLRTRHRRRSCRHCLPRKHSQTLPPSPTC